METTTNVYAKTWQELALHLVHQSKARYDAYEEDVRDWYRNGDGRSTRDGGRGHTYPYCIHGVSRWVDYDCACGACEDGDGYWDYLRELHLAKHMAKQAFATRLERINLYVKASNMGMPLSDDWRKVNDWVMAPVEMRK